MRAILALEDGTVYEGRAFGAAGETEGEVVFNTSMTGYQEILTDPSYAGQIVTMTYPLIGNYGTNDEDLESARPQVRGFVVRELCRQPSNWRCACDLEGFLRRYGVMGIEGIDTRALTRRLRIQGTMRGILTTQAGGVTPAELAARARTVPELSGQDLVRGVTTPQPYTEGESNSGPRVVVLDFGAKRNIVRHLLRLGCRVVVVPAWTPAAEILALEPDGILLANGPGDPKDVPYGIATVRELLGQKPIFGICLGHQILALALGADTYKLKFGHRGGNHPVRDLATGRVYITSQNHGYAVAEESLRGTGAYVTHKNWNDQTVEGLRHPELRAFSVQYHPEASPGPTDSWYLFEEFVQTLPSA